MRAELLLALAALLSSTACAKKAPACEAPANLPRPMLEGPTVKEPRRLLPIGGYTLAMSWTPQHCAGRMTNPRDQLQCDGKTSKFGFTLHGLWPDGEGATWPQYCSPTRLVPDKVIRENLCTTPSVQLIQHEWEKHGTCMSRTPEDYFAKSRALFRAIRFPEMADYRGKRMTAGTFRAAFAKANEGMRADQIKLRITPGGWLEEVWLCLDKKLGRTACRAADGIAADRPIRIR